jgi:hypothetical protein
MEKEEILEYREVFRRLKSLALSLLKRDENPIHKVEFTLQ